MPKRSQLLSILYRDRNCMVLRFAIRGEETEILQQGPGEQAATPVTLA